MRRDRLAENPQANPRAARHLCQNLPQGGDGEAEARRRACSVPPFSPGPTLPEQSKTMATAPRACAVVAEEPGVAAHRERRRVAARAYSCAHRLRRGVQIDRRLGRRPLAAEVAAPAQVRRPRRRLQRRGGFSFVQLVALHAHRGPRAHRCPADDVPEARGGAGEFERVARLGPHTGSPTMSEPAGICTAAENGAGRLGSGADAGRPRRASGVVSRDSSVRSAASEATSLRPKGSMARASREKIARDDPKIRGQLGVVAEPVVPARARRLPGEQILHLLPAEHGRGVVARGLPLPRVEPAGEAIARGQLDQGGVGRARGRGRRARSTWLPRRRRR